MVPPADEEVASSGHNPVSDNAGPCRVEDHVSGRDLARTAGLHREEIAIANRRLHARTTGAEADRHPVTEEGLTDGSEGA